MRIASNKTGDIVRFFREELNGIYDKGEIETFIAYCFEAFVGMKRVSIGLNSTATVSESDLLRFNFAVKDLKRYKPIQYILGKADFYSMKLEVNEHVLIPRPETEELVELVVKEVGSRESEAGSWKTEDGIRKMGDIRWETGDEGRETEEERREHISILDIGTGSGCIAIALKKHLPAVAVYAVDVSEKALEVAERNAQQNNVDVEFHKYDILSSTALFPSIHAQFDIIVSNPPYIEHSEKEQMDKNVKDFEPHLALFVDDEDPLLFYKAILNFALKQLKKNGKIYFEINQKLGLNTSRLMENTGFRDIQLITDLNNNHRILTGILS